MNTNIATKHCSKKKTSSSNTDAMFMHSFESNMNSSNSDCCAHKNSAKKSSHNAQHSAQTIIRAKVNVGWGNQLFIRGEGADLSWNQGQAMQNVNDNEWEWTTNNANSSTLTFKFLINDQQWNNGDNYSTAAGLETTIEPNF